MPEKKKIENNNDKKIEEQEEKIQDFVYEVGSKKDNKEKTGPKPVEKNIILDEEAEKMRSAVLNVIKKSSHEVEEKVISKSGKENSFEHKNIAKVNFESKNKKSISKFFQKKRTKLSVKKTEKLFSKVKILSDSLDKKKPQGPEAKKVAVEDKRIKKDSIKERLINRLSSFSFNKSGALIFGLNLLITIVLLGGILLTVIGLGMYRNTFLPSDTQNDIADLIPYPAGIVNSHVLTISELRRDVAAMNRYFVVQADEEGFFGNIPAGDDVQSIVWDRFVQDVLLFDIADQYGLTVTDRMLQDQLDAIIEESGDFSNFENRIALLYGWSVETFTDRVIKPFVLREAVAGKVFRDNDLRQSRSDLAVWLAGELQANPDNFEEIAREYSEDELTREDGGYLGTFERGSLAPALNDALANLDIGEVSDVIESGEGYEIIQLLDRTPAKGSFELSARRLLIRYPTLELLLQKEREKATIYRFVR